MRRYSSAGAIISGAVPMAARKSGPHASSALPAARPQTSARVRELQSVASAAARRADSSAAARPGALSEFLARVEVVATPRKAKSCSRGARVSVVGCQVIAYK